MNTIAYRLKDALYLNITNRCTNQCCFCIRGTETGVGYDLWLEHEPTTTEVIAAIGDPKVYSEVVFCGYGEPLESADVVVEVAEWLKTYHAKVRINTNGLADLFLAEDILPRLQGLVDVISISINAQDAQTYHSICRSQFGEKAFPAILAFTERSKKYIPKVIGSVVRYPGVDIPAVEKIVAALGVEFRVREYLG